MSCKGDVCPKCRCNIYIDNIGDKHCGCNTPRPKGFENNKECNGGLVKSIFTCERCHNSETIYATRKVNKSRKYCDKCRHEMDLEQSQEKYLKSKVK